MRPTSAYGEQRIVLNLYLVGCFWPESWPGKAGYESIWRASAVPERGPARFVNELPRDRFWYSHFSMDSRAQDFAEDLWFKRFPEPNTAYADAVVAVFSLPLAIPAYVLCIAGLSYVAGGLTGIIVLGKWRPYGRMALWNVFTLLALVFFGLRRAQRPPDVLLKWWRTDFVVVFTVIFMVLTLVAQWLLRLPLPG
jgi:hypothetical protein